MDASWFKSPLLQSIGRQVTFGDHRKGKSLSAAPAFGHLTTASKRLFTSFQFTTFHQLVTYSARLFWYLR